MKLTWIVFFLVVLSSCSQGTYDVALIKTKYGDIEFMLHEQTPRHKKNFMMLAKSQFYDGTYFHRLIPNFMIQGGDPYSKTQAGEVGTGGTGYLLPAEIDSTLSPKRGAVVAARLSDEQNPYRESNGSQFYIVQNENRASHLNGKNTIFGQVISGWEVLDRINNLPTDMNSKPVEKILMAISVKKMKKEYVDKKLSEATLQISQAQVRK